MFFSDCTKNDYENTSQLLCYEALKHIHFLTVFLNFHCLKQLQGRPLEGHSKRVHRGLQKAQWCFPYNDLWDFCCQQMSSPLFLHFCPQGAAVSP